MPPYQKILLVCTGDDQLFISQRQTDDTENDILPEITQYVGHDAAALTG